MRKLMLAVPVLVALVIAGLAAGNARADPPSIVPFSFSFTDTDTCPGIAIDVTVSGRDIILEETDDFVRFHEDAVGIASANGKTLIDNDHFNVQLDFANGVSRFTGAVFNIQAPGVGNLLMDVGIIIFDDEGNVIHQGGPHPAFFGDFQGFCDYLADP